MVDETGHHIGGMGKWGNCAPGCPIPPDDREAPVTKPNKGKKFSSPDTKTVFVDLTVTIVVIVV